MAKADKPLKDETHRSVGIGFAGNLVTMGGGALMAYLAGPLGAFAAINVGLLIVAFGYRPRWFRVPAKSNARAERVNGRETPRVGV